MKYLTSQIEFVNNESKFLDSENEETVIVTLEQTEAIYGADTSCNVEWCNEHDVKVAHQGKLSGGGCIIGVKGNLFIDIKRKNKCNECLSDSFAKALAEYFKNKGLSSVRCDNNDILIDNFKVASGCETIYKQWMYMGYQISIFQDIETIKGACNKPMIKTPKALSEYGVTTEEMVKFCEEYWSKK